MKKEEASEHYLYHRTQEFKIDLPLQFWLLCKTLQAPPGKVLIEFMKNVGREPGTEEFQKNRAKDYLLAAGYGQELFSREDILHMLGGLDAIAGLWLGMGSIEGIAKHIALRDNYLEIWEEMWRNRLKKRYKGFV